MHPSVLPPLPPSTLAQLSAFETIPKRRFAMAKRRIAILGPVLGELNARVYTGIVRQLSFELGEISNTLLEVKVRILFDLTSADISISYESCSHVI